MRWRLAGALMLCALGAVPLHAQASELAAACTRPDPNPERLDVPRICLISAQALASAHPQIGMLLAAGNPVAGSVGAAGLRLGRYVRTDAALRLNFVQVRLPDVRAKAAAASAPSLGEGSAFAAPALKADLALGVFSGISLSPRVGGIGALDALATASWLPFRALDTPGFASTPPRLGYGLGARVGLLREGFATPGIALSLMHHRVGGVRFGQVCADGAGAPDSGAQCSSPRDVGEFSFDVAAWSGRAVIGRRFLGVGMLAGAGYDRFSGSGEHAFRVPAIGDGTGETVLRQPRTDLREGRWSAFANLSYTLLLTTVALELGWLQGGDPLAAYATTGAAFDPRRGSVFGGVGGRIAF